jgi:predicted phage terminase large subunit-like protein
MTCGCLIYPLCKHDPRVDARQDLRAAAFAREDQEPLLESVEPIDEDELAERTAKLAEATEVLRLIIRERGYRSLWRFVQQAFKAAYPAQELEDGPHIKALCDHVQWQLEDRGKSLLDRTFKMRAQNLLINVAPRSLKTFILSCATLWCWIHWPDTSIKYLSSNPRVALDSARLVHSLITESPWWREVYCTPDAEGYAPVTWTLRRNQSAPSDMANTAGGVRQAFGLDAGITGAGCTWLIIDDPHDLKATRAEMAKSCSDYDLAVHNRINDPRTSIRTAIMQRMDVSDFSAHVLRTGAWIHVRIPMHFRVTTQCRCGTCVGVNVFGWRDWRKNVGDVLHPRFTPEFLAQEKERLNLHNASNEAQMEQEPVDLRAGMVKRADWGFFSLQGHVEGDWPRPAGCNGTVEGDVPRPTIQIARRGAGWAFDEILLSIDCANKETKKGSRWGLLACGRAGARRFVLADGSRRGSYSAVKADAIGLVLKYRPRRLLIEDKAAGPVMISELEAAFQEGKIKDEHGVAIVCRVEAIAADGGGGDKETRMAAVLPIIEAGLVYLLEGAAWLGAFVEEIHLFPKEPNDRGDALSQFLERTRYVASTLDIPADAMARVLTGNASAGRV